MQSAVHSPQATSPIAATSLSSSPFPAPSITLATTTLTTASISAAPLPAAPLTSTTKVRTQCLQMTMMPAEPLWPLYALLRAVRCCTSHRWLLATAGCWHEAPRTRRGGRVHP